MEALGWGKNAGNEKDELPKNVLLDCFKSVKDED